LSKREKRERKFFFARHLVVVVSSSVVVVVVVVSLAATHVSTSSAGTHEVLMGNLGSPFSDTQTN
jgi:hypothetical protein